jgi:hypothetical protein
MTSDTPLVTGVDFAVVPTKDRYSAVEIYGEILGCRARPGRANAGRRVRDGNAEVAVLEAARRG